MKTQNTKKKVAIGLSGGVDSSVAAYLLLEQGYDVTGVYMQCWDAKADGCKAEEDRADAVKIAGKLGIPFISLDFRDTYKDKVISYFYSEYSAGRTPNPDVMCNKEIKFGLFFEWAVDEGYDFVATGHYAQVAQKDGEFKLLQGSDESKDQSYFLYLLKQKQLERVLFPLGTMKKAEVRKLATKQGFHNAKKPDSTGICFIGEVDIKNFLSKQIALHPGKVLNLQGETVGEHDGAEFYTIGQRHGFRINKYQGVPLYVILKDIEKNELVVGPHEECMSEMFEVSQLHWIGKSPNPPFDCRVRIRHLGKLHTAFVSKTASGLLVQLSEPIFGVAPGQSAVFYKNYEVLGGGIIL